jgi:uncharacterized protein YbgA (DUF1722 family)/uncharacterized protein YbbK (DUF523 family)
MEGGIDHMKDRINLGISACLLGEPVRYDGGHKLDHYLKDIVGQFVNWIPVCPEVECGLSVPREAMHLVGDQQSPRLVTLRTGIDYTEQMLTWSEKKLDELEKLDLCGFVFKSKSPSSGMKDIKIYNSSGMAVKKGTGIFARQFMDRFPLLPVEDEGRLHDAGLRENFIERVFVFKRWKDLVRDNFSLDGLISFHTDHKLLIMSHSVKHVSELGRIVAQAKAEDLAKVFDRYLLILMAALKLEATVKKNVNVLQHITGYFKKTLSADEKQELIEIIENYHNGSVPLIVPVVLLNHYVRRFANSYLKRQYYLNPHPIELMLRNHV